MQLLRKILWPFSLLYAAGVYIRNLTYDLKLRSSRKFDTPTVCVGNLSLGGTGKTPMIEWLLRNATQFKRIAILSRGYRRKSSGFLIATEVSEATDIGDEPLQIYSKFPSVIMAVDANRRRGISILEEKYHPEVIFLDDAFQHRKIAPECSILLTSYSNLYQDDWFLPNGTLRDAKSQARRADQIIVTKCPQELSRVEMDSIRDKINPESYQEVLFCTLDYSNKIRGLSEDKSLGDLRHSRVTVVTGIANPQPFIQYLEEHLIEVNHLKFRDHHEFTTSEVEALRNEELILTTEKDYVRSLNKLDQAGYLEVQHRFLGEGKQKLLSAIDRLKR